jgi:hypothetical protein
MVIDVSVTKEKGSHDCRLVIGMDEVLNHHLRLFRGENNCVEVRKEI